MQLGLVASYSRPGGKITGVSVIVNSLTAKRIELLCELVPTSVLIAELVNPINRVVNEELKDARAATRALGAARCRGQHETRDRIRIRGDQPQPSGRPGGLAGGFSVDQPQEIVGLAAIHRIPAVYAVETIRRERRPHELRGRSRYCIGNRHIRGKILSGEKPEELPVAADQASSC